MTYLLGLRPALQGTQQETKDRISREDLPRAWDYLHNIQTNQTVFWDRIAAREKKTDKLVDTADKIEKAAPDPAAMNQAAQDAVVAAQTELADTELALVNSKQFVWNYWPLAEDGRDAMTRVQKARAALEGAEAAAEVVSAAVAVANDDGPWNPAKVIADVREAVAREVTQTQNERSTTGGQIERDVAGGEAIVGTLRRKLDDTATTKAPAKTGGTQRRRVGLATETDSAVSSYPAPPGVVQRRPVGLAVESGTALALVRAAPAVLAEPVTYTDVPYGSALNTAAGVICGQNANVHIPAGVPKGCILWFPGGGWAVANKDNDGNPAAAAALQALGYVVINCNYRQATDGGGPGPYTGQGGYYANGSNDGIADCIRILRYLISRAESDGGEAAEWSPVWTTVRELVAEYGLLVAGVSAGGYMVMHSTLRYGTASGNWPKAAFNFCGPADVTYAWGTPTADQRAVTANYFRNYGAEYSPAFEAAQEQASMQYSFGAYSAAFAASPMQFHFGRNANDTVVTTAMLSPFIEQIRAVAPSRVREFVVSEMWPPGATEPWPTNHNTTQTMDTYIRRVALQVF